MNVEINAEMDAMMSGKINVEMNVEMGVLMNAEITVKVDIQDERQNPNFSNPPLPATPLSLTRTTPLPFPVAPCRSDIDTAAARHPSCQSRHAR